MAGIKTTLVVIGFFFFPLVMAQEVVNNAYGVCPILMNKEEEEMIKEQERKNEEMEEIMREIEITCLDECKTGQHNCHDDAHCTNTKRSFTCTCKPGYFGDGVNCADIDECRTEKDNCDEASSWCYNVKGSFECVCKKGFTKNGQGKCIDINECETEEHSCDADANCVNTIGSFMCACKLGFTGNGVSCTDTDECKTKKHNCNKATSRCCNVKGSFECVCKEGFTENGQGKCRDIDECAIGKHNCNGTTICRNTKGSFLCLNCTATPPPPTTTPTTTPGCPEGWVENGTHCYLYIKSASTWNRGEEECLQLCANLPVVKSAGENKFLVSLMEKHPRGNGNLWLGMESVNGDNVFQWVDGTQVADGFSAWFPGEPNYPGEENCGYLYLRGSRKEMWNNNPCEMIKGLVCQKKK